MKNLCGVCKIVGLFAGIGALNWGLVSLFHVNLVEKIFGGMPLLGKVVYFLVGLSGLMLLVSYFKVCAACKKKFSNV